MTLADILDWIDGITTAEHYYIGKLDNKQDKSIGLYNRNVNRLPRTAIGGRDLASYDIKSVTLLIHWDRRVLDTENAAQSVYDALAAQEDIVIGDTKVAFLQLLQSEPVDVGTDDNGIYERVIEFDLYCNKR